MGTTTILAAARPLLPSAGYATSGVQSLLLLLLLDYYVIVIYDKETFVEHSVLGLWNP